MNRKFIELALKRQRLQLQAAEQRLRLAHALAAAAPALALGDRVRAGWHWCRAHPEWLAGAGLLLLVLRPRACWRWARRGFFAWRALRRLRRAATALLGMH